MKKSIIILLCALVVLASFVSCKEPHEHVFDQCVASSKYVKTQASCIEKAIYYKSCKCGEASPTETFEGAGGDHAHSTTISDVCYHCDVCDKYIFEDSEIAVYNATKKISYDTLAAANTAVDENDVIVLNKDLTIAEQVKIIKAGVTLDLNGHTIERTTSGCAILVRDSTSSGKIDGVTIKNGTIKGIPSGNGTSSLFCFVLTTNSTVSNMNIVSNVVADTATASAFYVNGSQVTANNINVIGKTICFEKSNGDIDLVINKGTFVKDPNATEDYVLRITGDNAGGTVVIDGVTMTGTIDIPSAAKVPALTLKAGTYGFDPTAYVDGTAYTIVGTGPYVVAAK